jgi:hypothetical protein
METVVATEREGQESGDYKGRSYPRLRGSGKMSREFSNYVQFEMHRAFLSND